MMLHAWKLTLPRPPKPPIEAVAPLPPAFTELGFDLPTIADAA
jgi:hypothetical protein